ncbi:MAG: hypothetical protein JNL74_09980 [Fibrobacteres bacterium]|nr:hypothetical protein [Fibrobacterota bacterium]
MVYLCVKKKIPISYKLIQGFGTLAPGLGFLGETAINVNEREGGWGWGFGVGGVVGGSIGAGLEFNTDLWDGVKLGSMNESN